MLYGRHCAPSSYTALKVFEKDETYEEVTDKIVKLAEQLEMEFDVTDVEELIESHGAELSNEGLIELEADKVAEQTEAEAEDEAEAEAEDEPVEEPRRFNTKEMAIAFREIALAMAQFEMDHSSSRFLKVNRGINDTLACYREIYEERREATVQSSLYKFVRKAERPAPYTSPQPSTSSAPSVPLPADDEPDDAMPVSSISLSTN
jgi:hypothetical protein